MNAALAHENGATKGPPASVASSRYPHASFRQLAAAVAILAAAGGMTGVTIAKMTGTPATYSGFVEYSGSVQLDFTQTGRVATLLVRPGESVKKGQALATEDTSAATAAVHDAQATLTADEEALAALRSPSVGGATQENISLQVQQAQSTLSSAEQQAHDASAQATAQIGRAQQAVTDAQNLLQQDSLAYEQACPDGTTPPPGVSQALAGDSNPATQGQISLYENCLSLNSQVVKDNAALSDAQANLQYTTASAHQLNDSAAAAVTAAQAQLALNQTLLGVDSQPAATSQIAQAQATVAEAKAQLDQEQANLRSLTLFAPTDGVIASIGGAVGDLDGNTGVHTYAGPSPATPGNSPTFSLFPSSPSATSTGNSQNDNQPLITITGGQVLAVAQVGESEASKLKPGGAAHVTINVLAKTLSGTVEQVVPIPIRQNGTVSYQVRISVPSWPPSVLDGMTVSVRFG